MKINNLFLCMFLLLTHVSLYAETTSANNEKNYIVQDVTYSNVCTRDGTNSWYCDNPEEYTIQDPDDPNKRYKWFLPDDTSNNAAVGAIFSVSKDGTKEYINHWIDEKFQGSGTLTINADRSYVDASTGKIVIYTNNGYREFDPKDNSFSLTTNNHTTESGTYFKGVKPLDSLIREESDGSIHIGENSLITVEEDGKQQLYATDANGDQIDINIKKGSDLLVDGKSVSQAITDVATNTTNIATNTQAITSLGTRVDGLTTLVNTFDQRITDLQTLTGTMMSEYRSGIASSVALSQIRYASKGFSIGVGQGEFKDKDEMAVGIGYGGEFNDRVGYQFQFGSSGDTSGFGFTITF